MLSPSCVVPTDDDLLLADPWADFASAQSKRAASQMHLNLFEQEEPEPAQPLPVTIH